MDVLRVGVRFCVDNDHSSIVLTFINIRLFAVTRAKPYNNPRELQINVKILESSHAIISGCAKIPTNLHVLNS